MPERASGGPPGTGPGPQAEALRELRAGLAAQARLAAFAAHEINGPLAGIKSAVALLGLAVPADHPHHGYAALVDREVDRISALLRLMYGLHRREGKEPAGQTASTLLQDQQRLLESRFLAGRVRFDPKTEIPESQPLREAPLLRHILFNLLQNAIEATPPEGTVSCRIRQDGGWLELEVRDQGPGLPAGMEDQIWAPGFTLKRSPIQTGLALGLSGCRLAAEALGGTLGAASQPGGGSVFTLKIPMATNDSA